MILLIKLSNERIKLVSLNLNPDSEILLSLLNPHAQILPPLPHPPGRPLVPHHYHFLLFLLSFTLFFFGYVFIVSLAFLVSFGLKCWEHAWALPDSDLHCYCLCLSVCFDAYNYSLFFFLSRYRTFILTCSVLFPLGLLLLSHSVPTTQMPIFDTNGVVSFMGKFLPWFLFSLWG